MKHFNPDNRQVSINVEQLEFMLAEYLTTRRLRSLIYQIAGESLTAREIEQKGRSGHFEIPWQNGVLIVISTNSATRLLRWNLRCLPNSILSAA